MIFEKVSKRISDYLMIGMHHATKEGQEKIRQIVAEMVKEEFSKVTPSEFVISIHKIEVSETDFEI